jgi:hypothetical protein
MNSTRVPVVANPIVSGTTRFYDVGSVGEIDPCAATYSIQGGVWTMVRPVYPGFPTTNWHGPVPPSLGYHTLLYHPVSPDYMVQHALVLVDANGQQLPSGNNWYQYHGFRIGVNLMQPLSIGDFVSPAPTLGTSSLALLPAGLSASSTGWMGLSRQTIAGTVDLMTGLPLIQVTDLELPFDGATFRLTRTRSNMRHDNLAGSGFPYGSGSDDWWDWTGLGWMIGENPILLIDSSLPNIVGDQPRTTRLVLDAHHSIPFQLIESDGRYEAPPRFRATLSHNGTGWGVDQQTGIRRWTEPPTRYEIGLYEGALKYTFVVLREDVPSNTWDKNYLTNTTPPSWQQTSYHNRPLLPGQGGISEQHNPLDRQFNPGFGVPYMALCSSIKDAYGHEVEMEYVGVRSRHMDDPLTEDCIECQQDGLAKGQLKSIKLRVRHGEQVVTKWTLLYAHRRFAGLRWGGYVGQPWGLDGYDNVTAKCPNEDPGRYELHGHNAIDRIYVFEGDVATAALTIRHTDTPGFDDHFGNTGRDPIFLYNEAHSEGLPTNWRYQIRYHYDFWHCENDLLFHMATPHTQPAMGTYPWLYGRAVNAPKGPPVLMMTTVASRPTGSGAPSLRRQVYSYAEGADGWGPEKPFHEWVSRIPWLNAVFSNEDVTRVLAAQSSLTLEKLAFRRVGDVSITPELTATIMKYASLRLDASPHSDWPVYYSTSDRPSVAAVQSAHHLIYSTSDRFNSDSMTDTVGDITTRGPAGEERHYRVHRLVLAPDSAERPSSDDGLFVNWMPSSQPMASRWFSPYAWQGYNLTPLQGTPHPDLAQMPDLSKRRFIVFIDEFESREKMQGQDSYGGAAAIKAGQRSRRVVELNGSGVILRERSWQFTPTGTLMSGSGLGEDFKYQRVFDYFGMDEEDTCPTMPASGHASASQTAVCSDPTKMSLSAANEMLLVEHRSIGWSVGCGSGSNFLENGQPGQGLVTFFEYKKFDPPNPVPTWASQAPTVHLVAEGIQRGATSPSVTLYTKQYFRNSADPSTVEVSVEFTGPQATLLTEQQRPTYGTSISHDALNYRATHFVTQFATPPNPNLNPELRPRLTGRTVIHPPRQQRPNGDWYYPIEREVYDDEGGLRWSVNGLVWNPVAPMTAPPSQGSPDPLASLIFTYHQRDAMGRTEATVIDVANPHTGGSIPSAIPQGANIVIDGGNVYPDDWNRIGAGSALQYVTQFAYDDQQPSDIYFPSGLRYARRWVTHNESDPNNPSEPGETWCEEFIFNNIKPSGGQTAHGQPGFTTQSPGERREYNGPRPEGAPRKVERGIYTDPHIDIVLRGREHATNVERIVPNFVPFAQVQLALDANGRPANANLLEHDASGALLSVGSKEINELVDVRREREIWGNVTRLTRNLIGQHRRTYAGTNDRSWTGDHAQKSGGVYVWNPSLGAPEERSDHNMVLLERMNYGESYNDAWLPTVHRRYASHPEWADTFYIDPNDQNDTAGFATVTSYDWRMRPVRVDVRGKGNPATSDRLSTTLTYLDVAGRPRLVVTYGKGTLPALGSGLDPVERTGAESAMPAASAFYNVGTGVIKPTSIVETIYGPDGNAKEVKTYDLNWTYAQGGEPPYQASWHGFGPGNQEVFTRRPDGPVTVTKLDGAWRVASVSNVRPGPGSGGYEYELSRSESVYDGTGNVVESLYFERAVNDSYPDLVAASSGGNAVRTRTCYWYDTEKRLIATMELGTEQSDGYVAGAPGSLNPLSSPAPSTNGVYEEGAWTSVPTAFSPTPPAGARVSVSIYEQRSGNLKFSIAPNLAVTEYQYDLNNRLESKIENACAPEAKDRRCTAHGYQYGRLVTLAAKLDIPNPANPTEPNEQVSRVVYGADIVDEDFDIVSRSNALVGELQLPDPNGIGILPFTAVTLRYTFSGQIAERTDARGVVFRYRYDGLERLSSVQVGYYLGSTFHAGYPASLSPPGSNGQPGPVPVDRIGFVKYAYSDRGHLETITAYPGSTAEGVAAGSIITQNKYVRDDRGNLLAEYQSRGAAVDVNSPRRVNYSWDYQPSGTGVTDVGRNRLLGMTYPGHGSLARRTVAVGYGDEGSAEDATGRVATLESKVGTDPNVPLSPMAAFTYFGGGRRIETKYGADAVVGSLRADYVGVGAAGLDRFGRVKDLHYRAGAGPWVTTDTLYRAEYTYDAAGNRKTAKITQAPEPTPSIWDNKRSQLHSYNALGQLLGSQVGSLAFDTSTGEPSISSLRREDQWRLDVLGNWNGNGGNTSGPLPGRTTSINIPEPLTGNPPQVTNRRDITDSQNRLVTRITDTGSTPTRIYLSFDAAGNLTCDGLYYYQYDAWNRLVQVNRAAQQYLPSGQTVLASDGHTVLNYIWVPKPDKMLKHHTYDGLGRLIRTQSPYPNVDYPNHGIRSEHFYYDGIRRIQELIVDPLFSLDDSEESNNSEVENAAAAAQLASPFLLDGSAAPIGYEQAQETELNIQVYLEREYLWGPGDRGVDELLVQFDHTVGRGAWWVIQDDGGDVVAVCDTVTTGSNAGKGRVVQQLTYDAYGEALTMASLQPHPALRCGHKGLFVDRLDAGVMSSNFIEYERIVPFGQAICYNRNRTYAPMVGRFLQADPNETGAILLDAARHSGVGPLSPSAIFSLQDRFFDGANAYQYIGSNPQAGSDPLGLFIGEALGAYVTLGASAGVIAYGLTSEYAANLEHDLDWAMDWSQQDDWHTRGDNSWIDAIYKAVNINGIVDDYLIPDSPFEVVEFGGPQAGVIRTITVAGKVLRKTIKHHALPKYLARLLGKESKVLAKLPKKFHQPYHNHISQGMGKNSFLKCPPMNAPRAKWDLWFKDMSKRGYPRPVAQQMMETRLKRLTKQFEEQNKLEGLYDELLKALK